MTKLSSGRGPLASPPTIDERKKEQLIEQIARLAPHYTPEWRFRPDDPDPGSALALMFAHLLSGNIERLNQVPAKSFLAFLNRFHVELAQAKPAFAQLAFQLAEGTPEPVFIERGVQVAASVPGEPRPILFETASAALLTPARLTDVLSVSPRLDRIVRLAADGEMSLLPGAGRGTAVFGTEGDNLQEHAMYLKHDYLFLLRHPALLELTVHHGQNEQAALESVQLLTDPAKVRWEYYSGGEWVEFQRSYGAGTTIRLLKLATQPVDSFVHDEVAGRWIRCRAVSMEERSGAAALGKVQLDRLLLKSEYASPRDDDGIRPDRLYFNDVQLSDEEGCMPFGDFFALFGLFYVSSEEVLSKRGATVTLKFGAEIRQHTLIPEQPPNINWKLIMKRHEIEKAEQFDPVTVATIQWEYWNGAAWVMLPIGAEAQKLFSVPWEGEEEREISFVCPEDMAPISVNAEENYWIRGRIVQILNAYSPKAIYYSPVVSNLRMRFGYERPERPPQKLMLQNNMEWKERTKEAQTGLGVFRPFLAMEGRYPALWLGFDQPPERGPIHLYLQMVERRIAESDVPFIEWEYLKGGGAGASWAPLPAADETNGFTRSGDVQFVGPRDYAASEFFGMRRYWIRAVNRDGRYDKPSEAANVPRLLNAALNTIVAVQQETVQDELPQRIEIYDSAEEQVSERYVLAEKPVLSEEVWVDETGEISKEELEELELLEDRIETIRDSEKELLRVWVRYYPVEQFLRSGPKDRHYRIDRATGTITFGNGKEGKKPQLLGDDTVRVTYAAGGGKRGNVPAGTISTMQDAIAYVAGVTNPFPASGGCDLGTVEEATIRGPKLFGHRNRAVTAEDFEWLTREAHPNVAKVKCLPNVNAKLEKEPGAVSIVVYPKSGIGSGSHFQELKRVVEASLLDKAASGVAFPGNVQIIAPALLEIGVYATVWVKSMDDVVPVEREIVRKLNGFLDPISGNADGQGWEIGRMIHHSMFYALLKSIGPVVHIPQLALEVYKTENGERTEWNADRIVDVPHGIFVPGDHRITVEVKK
ncbi:baseplate J/gp47 family protein [Cohnella fermenti]|uniref:Putative baseplate assembly protein n=1 Tax=Cohnella fermenti TaxID=2565925 RepID=A0A4S4BG58_9BACL|nr:baseplate J/gp47 family protein [Cohnella fermenti]THF73388.1 putative baseplate assembly protein [Cohnella fermenti]